MDMTPIASSAFAGLLERATGQQLVAGRRWRIDTALGPVMRANGIDSLDRLAAEVGRNDGSPLAKTVIEALLNNETSFFRDAQQSEKAHSAALIQLIAAREAEGRRRLRIWSAGCSTGQEAYSFVIGLKRLGSRLQNWDIRVVGTDISGAAVDQARQGLYSQMEVQRGLSIRDLLANFDSEGDNWRVHPEIRAQASFARHNLFNPPPGGDFDVILCRNVLLYFNPERRRIVLDNLASAMAQDGYLMLGAGETMVGSGEAFAADPENRGFYRKATAEQ